MDAAELADLRAIAEEELSDTCEVSQKVAGADDGLGGFATSYGSTIEYACLLQEESEREYERILGEKVTAERYFTLLLPFDAIIQPTDRVVHAGVTYSVVSEDDSGRSNALLQRVVIRRSV